MASVSLTRAEVRKALKKLRTLGIFPPSIGYCVTVFPGETMRTDFYGQRGKVELCRHPKSRHIKGDTGYQIVTSRKEHGLFGGRRR